MDIWEKMYEKAKAEYHPEEVTPFVYAHGVVAALNMYVNSGQTKIKRLIAFRDNAPSSGGSGMPCGACREFLYQFNEENEDMEIMVDFEKRQTITIKELMPNWWGKERYAEEKSK